ncbi:MAG: terminase family protein [Chitinispirillaceae bacterium]|nr:terminase family protein [Chitinispirillaceae bacterium]
MTAAAQKTKPTGTPKFFLPYQIRWLRDGALIKIWEKSRRIGATYVQSYEDVEDIVTKREYTPGRPVRKIYFTSADESAAREYIDYCADWAKLFQAAASKVGSEVLDEEKGVNALVIEFANGGKIYAMTSNPKRFRSKGGKVVWDEAAWHEDQKAMWKACHATASVWGYPIRILSTHHGKQSLFYRFTADVKSGKMKWSRHFVTIVDAVNDGLVDKLFGRVTTQEERKRYLDDLHANARSEELWEEEYMCEPVDATTAFIPYELLYGAEKTGILMTMLQLMDLREGDLYAGWDVARKRHFSIIWILQKLGDLKYSRHVIPMLKMPFAQQQETLKSVMALPRMRRVCIDATGMGMPIAEAATKQYGQYRAEGITMGAAIKEELAWDVYNALEDKRLLVEPDDTTRASFHAIKKVVLAGKNDRFDADATEEAGHGDHFWACSLALHAAKSSKGPVVVASKSTAERGGITRGFFDVKMLDTAYETRGGING